MTHIEERNYERIRQETSLESVNKSRQDIWNDLWREVNALRVEYNTKCPAYENVSGESNPTRFWLTFNQAAEDFPGRVPVRTLSAKRDDHGFMVTVTDASPTLVSLVISPDKMVSVAIAGVIVSIEQAAKILVDAFLYPDLPRCKIEA